MGQVRKTGVFQSTRPARGATTAFIHLGDAFEFQSTRPARGATPVSSLDVCPFVFQSTRPARGATVAGVVLQGLGPVSIHAPRAGRDAGGEIGRGVPPPISWTPG